MQGGTITSIFFYLLATDVMNIRQQIDMVLSLHKEVWKEPYRRLPESGGGRFDHKPGYTKTENKLRFAEELTEQEH